MKKSHFDKFLFWQIDNSTNCRFDQKSLAWTMTSNIIVLLRDEGGEEKRRRDFFLMKQKSSGKQLRGDKDVTWSESKLEETLGIQSNRSFSSFSSFFLAKASSSSSYLLEIIFSLWLLLSSFGFTTSRWHAPLMCHDCKLFSCLNYVSTDRVKNLSHKML